MCAACVFRAYGRGPLCVCGVCSLMGREKLPLMYVFLFLARENTKINLLIYMASYMDGRAALSPLCVRVLCLYVHVCV